MKKDKVIYWSTTGLLALGFGFSGILYLTKNPEIMAQFKSIGIPEFFVSILGMAKIAGAVGIINPWSLRLNEWAYAGYSFVLIGAVWTHIATGTPFIAPLVFLAITAVSYLYFIRLNGLVLAK